MVAKAIRHAAVLSSRMEIGVTDGFSRKFVSTKKLKSEIWLGFVGKILQLNPLFKYLFLHGKNHGKNLMVSGEDFPFTESCLEITVIKKSPISPNCKRRVGGFKSSRRKDGSSPSFLCEIPSLC